MLGAASQAVKLKALHGRIHLLQRPYPAVFAQKDAAALEPGLDQVGTVLDVERRGYATRMDGARL